MNALVTECLPRTLPGSASRWVATLMACDTLPLAAQVILPPLTLRRQIWVEILLHPKVRCGREADNERLWHAAADAGCEAALDAKVLAEALRWLAGRPAIHLTTINLTAPSLRAGFADRLLQLCQHHEIAPQRLCLELSERTPIDPNPGSIAELSRLSQAGIALAIDDFGASGGATHLGLLARVPMRLLKVDTALTQAAATTSEPSQARRVLDGIVVLARSLGMVPVLEGIETARESALISQFDGAAWQGYAIGRPLAIN